MSSTLLGDRLQCWVCSLPLSKLKENVRNAHLNQCLDEQEEKRRTGAKEKVANIMNSRSCDPAQTRKISEMFTAQLATHPSDRTKPSAPVIDIEPHSPPSSPPSYQPSPPSRSTRKPDVNPQSSPSSPPSCQPSPPSRSNRKPDVNMAQCVNLWKRMLTGKKLKKSPPAKRRKIRHTGTSSTTVDARNHSSSKSVTDSDEDEILLLRFDVDTTYCPRCGLTRMERYNRARNLNLRPPQAILEAIERTPIKMYTNEGKLVLLS